MRKYSFVALLTTLVIFTSFANAEDRFVDSDDYKEPEFKKCFINDYSRLVEGDDVDWVWIEKGANLSKHKIVLSSVTSQARGVSGSDKNILKIALQEEIEDMDAHSSSPLTIDVCIYHFKDATSTPYVGHYLAQAELGIEAIIKDKNKTVAIIRHYKKDERSKEGVSGELAEDIIEFIEDN
ncbi:MAG: hypothetical protein P8Y43_08685 [Sulfurovaceae bacterium]|jgi:hypothetical protein